MLVQRIALLYRIHMQFNVSTVRSICYSYVSDVSISSLVYTAGCYNTEGIWARNMIFL